MECRTLLSLGSVNADFQVRVDASPGSAETLLAHDQTRLAGGKAGNVAYLARLFDCRAVLLARVGDDELASQALAPLRDHGVDICHVTRAQGRATGLSMIMVPPDGKKHIVLATNANDAWDDASLDVVRMAIEQAPSPALLVVDYEIPAHVVMQAVTVARDRAIPVVLDPSFPDRVPTGILSKLKAITPNAAEARTLTGLDVDSPRTAAHAARWLNAKGVEIACVKLADGGCVLGHAEELIHLPAIDVDVLDTTGAGDAFTGALAAALLEGREPEDAAAKAVAASSLAVTGYGSQPAYAEAREVTAMAERIVRHARRLHV